MKSDPESGDQVTKFSHTGFFFKMEFLCKEKKHFWVISWAIGLFLGIAWFTLMDFLGV